VACEAESAAVWMGLEIEEGVLPTAPPRPGGGREKATTGNRTQRTRHTVSPDLLYRQSDATTTGRPHQPHRPDVGAHSATTRQGRRAGKLAGWTHRPAGSTTSGTVDKDTGCTVGSRGRTCRRIHRCREHHAITSSCSVENKPKREAGDHITGCRSSSRRGAPPQPEGPERLPPAGHGRHGRSVVEAVKPDQASPAPMPLAALGRPSASCSHRPGTSTDGDR